MCVRATACGCRAGIAERRGHGGAGAYLKAQPWARLAAVGYLAVLHLMLLACSHGGARHSADVRGVGSG